jgi:hypothetical protein
MENRRDVPYRAGLLAFIVCALSIINTFAEADGTNSSPGFQTNGPAVYRLVPADFTNSWPSPDGKRRIIQIINRTNLVFDHYLPDSLHQLIWTNFIAHTNGRTTRIWSVREHPPKWPAVPPRVEWDQACLMWGMKGLTAISPCWEGEGSSGQVPITALTRRHGYTRGHGMGPDGFTDNLNGRKVWFLTTGNALIEVKVAGAIVRTWGGGAKRDYSILLFDRDLPKSIQPMRVSAIDTEGTKYPRAQFAPRPLFETEQSGQVSAGIAGFSVNTWKGGDSGSPNMFPLPGELVFFCGRSTFGPSPEMQADMNELCEKAGLNPAKYQLRWIDLSAYRSF